MNGKAIYQPKGAVIKSNGYYVVYIPEHPYDFGRVYVYEHRRIIEKQLGRYLTSSEIVHHKDGNKLNNSVDNLELCSSIAEHKVEHRTQNSKVKRMPNEQNLMIECACGCGNTFLKYDEYGRERRYFGCGCPMRHKKKMKQRIVPCACGCGEKIEKYDKHGRIRRYISGHNGHKIPLRRVLSRDSGFSMATIIGYFNDAKLKDSTILMINNSILKIYGEDYIPAQRKSS